MHTLHFADNMIRLRRKKKITQEQLADFLGITKASVSKWETGQSLPDILLLPQLASFFDTTIDDLMGYEPQLSREQIQKIYRDLAVSFAEAPFDEVRKKSQELVKKYYSCYPFLFQICVLWLNHFMLADTEEKQRDLLNAASDLCSHILSSCKDIGTCEDTIILKSSIDLQLGNTEDVIDSLENILNPYRLAAQSDSVLIQAYLMTGQRQQAERFTQMSMYLHLRSLIISATHYLELYQDNTDLYEETIQRLEALDQAYHLSRLLPDAAALFWYQAAAIYCAHEEYQKALNMLQRYVDNIDYLLTKEHLSSHGDDYFSLIQSWYEMLDIGAEAPRDKKVILESFLTSLENPAFCALNDETEYIKLKKSIQRKAKHYE